MSTDKKRRSLLRYPATTVGLLVSGLLVVTWTVMQSGSPQPEPSKQFGNMSASTVNQESTAEKKWITTGVSTPPAGEALTGAAEDFAAPQAVQNGKVAKRVAALLEPLLPTGSTVATLVEYPQLEAATAGYDTPDGNHVTLTIHRLKKPIALEAITHNVAPDSFTDSPAGSQVVEVRTAMQLTPTGALDKANASSVQLILARTSGVLATLTVVPKTPGGTVQESSALTQGTLFTAARQKLDVEATDSVLK